MKLPKGELAGDPKILKPYILELEARAEKAEAEVQRLRVAVEALVEAGDRLAKAADYIDGPSLSSIAAVEWAEAKRAALRGGE